MKKFLVLAALLIGGAAAVCSLQSDNLKSIQLLNAEALAESEGSDCPNGCLDKIGYCNCYGPHSFQEATEKDI